ncbi:MAG: molecular chaperone HtpG, partial [Treponema sp.]|nr:molecular chaperone HtpG [Treponema sp.]
PACIVIDENDPSLQMERMMKAMGQGNTSFVKPILEINGDHPLVKKLEGDVAEETVNQISEVLLDQSLLIDGAELKDPNEFVKAINALLTK